MLSVLRDGERERPRGRGRRTAERGMRQREIERERERGESEGRGETVGRSTSLDRAGEVARERQWSVAVEEEEEWAVRALPYIL